MQEIGAIQEIGAELRERPGPRGVAYEVVGLLEIARKPHEAGPAPERERLTRNEAAWADGPTQSRLAASRT